MCVFVYVCARDISIFVYLVIIRMIVIALVIPIK